MKIRIVKDWNWSECWLIGKHSLSPDFDDSDNYVIQSYWFAWFEFEFRTKGNYWKIADEE